MILLTNATGTAQALAASSAILQRIMRRGHDPHLQRTAGAAFEPLAQCPERRLWGNSKGLDDVAGMDDEFMLAVFAPDSLVAEPVRSRTAHCGLPPVVSLGHSLAAHNHRQNIARTLYALKWR